VAAFQSGLYTPGSLAWRGYSLVDIVPGDLVAGAVLLATAALLLPAGSSAAAGGASQESMPAAGSSGVLRSMVMAPAGDSAADECAGGTASRPAAAAPQPLLIVQAAPSCSHPLRVWQLVQAMHSFSSASPSKLRLPLSPAPMLGPSYRPSRARVWLAKLLTAVKVGLAFVLCLAIRQPRLAAKLRSGYSDWATLNCAEYDFDLRFDCRGMDELAGQVAASERAGMTLTWRQGERDWSRYLMTMAVGVQQLELKQRTVRLPVAGVAHSFELLQPLHTAPTVVLGSD
jgi:hypothetical protein